MLVWAVAVAFALRCYTESVMTAYYVWPALAVAVVVAARENIWRFRAALVLAVFTTVVAQWNLGEWPWWLLDVGGMTAVLLVSVPRASLPALVHSAAPVRLARSLPERNRGGPTKDDKKRKRKAARSDRKSARR
jgi:hypothetical protein